MYGFNITHNWPNEGDIVGKGTNQAADKRGIRRDKTDEESNRLIDVRTLQTSGFLELHDLHDNYQYGKQVIIIYFFLDGETYSR